MGWESVKMSFKLIYLVEKMHQSWRGNAFSLVTELHLWVHAAAKNGPERFSSLNSHIHYKYCKLIIIICKTYAQQFKGVKRNQVCCSLSYVYRTLALLLTNSYCRHMQYLIYQTSHFTDWGAEDSGYCGLPQSFYELSPSRIRYSTVTKPFLDYVSTKNRFSVKVASMIVRKNKGQLVKIRISEQVLFF